ncbi:MAG: MBL fold metallo-hydrolase, partial [Bradymonadaceae bacterium]
MKKSHRGSVAGLFIVGILLLGGCGHRADQVAYGVDSPDASTDSSDISDSSEDCSRPDILWPDDEAEEVCVGTECECGLREYCADGEKCCLDGDVCVDIEDCSDGSCLLSSFCRPPCEGSFCGANAELCCEGDTPVCGSQNKCVMRCDSRGALCGESWDFCCPCGDICVDGACATPEPLRITFINVGQADAILIQKGDLDILVDAGRSYSPALQEALATITNTLDVLIITHPHLDHYGGARGILRNHQVDRIITNGERRGPPRDPEGSGVRWLEFEEEVALVGMTLQTWERGERVQLTDALQFTVLATGGDFPNTS